MKARDSLAHVEMAGKGMAGMAPADMQMLDALQRDAFDYFLKQANLHNGLVADTSRPGSPASIAVVGFALSACPVAVERGWIERGDAVQRCLTTLRFFSASDQSGAVASTGCHGFYFHFLDVETGLRAWQSELSSIDTALLIVGPMSDLCDPTVNAGHAERLAELRSRAASRLTGAAATKGSTARAADALTVLHALASSPETASDALTLLHELQVHQVELDPQAQELHESRAELEHALRRQTELYDFQPFACLTIDARRVLYELNATGAAMLGLARDEAVGLAIDAFFRSDSAGRFGSAIARVDAGTPRASCRLALCPKQGPERQVLASIAKDPAANRYLVSLADAGDEREGGPRAS